MQRRFALGALAAAALGTAPKLASAQKVLVYCPGGSDGGKSTTIINALTAGAGAPYAAADVKCAHNGDASTINLGTTDATARATLRAAQVLVVPSLADAGGATPYAVLRQAPVRTNLQGTLTGRVAVWSGTPDQQPVGDPNAAKKNTLIRNLVAWAAANHSGSAGTGLVVLEDLTNNGKYGWVAGIANVPPSTTVQVSASGSNKLYDRLNPATVTGNAAATAITRGANGQILAYTDMAAEGLAPEAQASAQGQYLNNGNNVVDGKYVLVTYDRGAAVAPTATFSAPASVTEGSAIALTLTPASAGTYTYAFDCGSGYAAEATSNTATCPTADNGTRAVKGKIVQGTLSTEYTATVTVTNVAPTAAFAAPSSAKVGATFSVSLASPADPSTADVAAGLAYAFDCGGGYSGFTSAAGASCTALAAGTQLVRAQIRDKDAGVSEYTASVMVSKTATALAAAAASGSYGGTATLSATLTADGAAVAGRPVTFSLNGAAAGTATTNASGVATIAAASLAGIGAGGYPGGVSAAFVEDAALLGSSAAAALEVGKATATLAFDAGSLAQTYTGQPRVATVTTSPAGLAGVAVRYDGSAAAPTSAGSYAVVASLTNDNYRADDASGTLVVGKAGATIAVDGLAQSYDGQPKPVRATVSPAVSGLAITYDGSATAPTAAGSYAVVVALANADYQAAPFEGTLTVGKAQPTLAVIVSPTTVPYGGQVTLRAQMSVGSTPLDGKTVTFRIGGQAVGSATTESVGGAATATLAIASPAALGARDEPYEVAALFAAEPNYAEAAGAAELTIERRAQALTFALPAEQTGKTFGDAPFGVAAYATTDAPADAGLAVSFASTTPAVCTVSAEGLVTIERAGQCTIRASQAGNANYLPSNAVDQTVTIARAIQTIDFAAPAAVTFAQGLTVALDASATSRLAVTFADATGKCTLAGATLAITGAGSCTVTATQGGDDNYEAAPSVTRSFTIRKGAATLSLGAAEFTYDGSPKPVGVTTAPAGLGGVTVTYDGSLDAPTGAGRYAVVASFVNDDYEAPDALGTLVINKARAVIALDDVLATYDGAAKAVVPQVTPTTAGLSISYAPAAGGPATLDAPTAAGEYRMVATLENPNYEADAVTKTLTIARRPITIVPVAGQTKVYGDAEPAAFGYTPSEPLVSGNEFTGTLTRAAGETVGGYPYALGDLAAGANYALSLAAGSFEITPAALTVTTDAQTRVYGDANPTLTGAVAGLKNGDAITASYATEATASSDVGSYAITATLVDPAAKLGNYTVTNEGGTLAITSAPLTITADAATKVYNAPMPGFTASYSGFVLGQNAAALGGTLAFVTAADKSSGVGSYDVTPAGLTSTNYAITFAKGTLTVTQQTPVMTVTADPIVNDQLTLRATLRDFYTPATSLDGRTVAITFNGTPMSATVTNGEARVTVSVSGLSAGTRPVAASFAGEANYTPATATASAVLVADVGGYKFLPPINAAGTRSSFKYGSTVPVKFALTANGAAVNAGQARFTATRADATPDALVNEAVDLSTTPDAGTYFRYDAGQYIYNLGTKPLAAGSWVITATLPDGSRIRQQIELSPK